MDREIVDKAAGILKAIRSLEGVVYYFDYDSSGITGIITIPYLKTTVKDLVVYDPSDDMLRPILYTPINGELAEKIIQAAATYMDNIKAIIKEEIKELEEQLEVL